MAFCLLNSYDSTSYQNLFTKLSLPKQIFKTKFLPCGLNQIYETKFAKPNACISWIFTCFTILSFVNIFLCLKPLAVLKKNFSIILNNNNFEYSLYTVYKTKSQFYNAIVKCWLSEIISRTLIYFMIYSVIIICWTILGQGLILGIVGWMII